MLFLLSRTVLFIYLLGGVGVLTIFELAASMGSLLLLLSRSVLWDLFNPASLSCVHGVLCCSCYLEQFFGSCSTVPELSAGFFAVPAISSSSLGFASRSVSCVHDVLFSFSYLEHFFGTCSIISELVVSKDLFVVFAISDSSLGLAQLIPSYLCPRFYLFFLLSGTVLWDCSSVSELSTGLFSCCSDGMY